MGWNLRQARVAPPLANFMPRRTGMHHLNGGITGFSCGFDLFGVLVAVADFQRECVVADMTLDVNTKVDFDTITFLKDGFPVPALNALNLVVGGEVRSEVVHGDRAGESRFATMTVNEPFC